MIITQTLTVEPSDKANGVCTAMIKESGDDYGKWRTHVCRYERPYMCKKALNSKIQTSKHCPNVSHLFRICALIQYFAYDSVVNVIYAFNHYNCAFQLFFGSVICSSLSVAPAICPSGWLSFSGNCYWMVSNQNLLTSWYLAQTKCSDMNANLVTIKKWEWALKLKEICLDSNGSHTY